MGDARIGTAGWSIPRQVAHAFPTEGSVLERYADRFDAVEINSSFYRPHRATTWRRWGESVPKGFRFSVKLPRHITHERKLAAYEERLAAFLQETGELGDKLAVILVQLPPSLAFCAATAAGFFSALAPRTHAMIACEPRHPSWFTSQVEAMLAGYKVARVAADPAICAAAAQPGGWRGLSYWRLHGSPVMYHSSYAARIEPYAELIADDAAGERWCIFDNTASLAAAEDALALQDLLNGI